MSAMPHHAAVPVRARPIPAARPALRPVPPPRPSRAVFLVRRLVVVGVLVLAALLGAAVAGDGAGADLADPVAGHVVLAPGETLWDVAVATAPEGVDAREQLARLRDLNGFGGGPLAPWTVVLLPAR